MIMFVRFSVSLLVHDFTKHVSQACRFRGLFHYAKISRNYDGSVNEALWSGCKFSGKSSPLLEMVVFRAIT